MLFVLFEDEIVTYRLSDGSFIKKTKLRLQNKEELDVFMQPERIYLKQCDTLFEMDFDQLHRALPPGIRSSNRFTGICLQRTI